MKQCKVGFAILNLLQWLIKQCKAGFAMHNPPCIARSTTVVEYLINQCKQANLLCTVVLFLIYFADLFELSNYWAVWKEP